MLVLAFLDSLARWRVLRKVWSVLFEPIPSFRVLGVVGGDCES